MLRPNTNWRSPIALGKGATGARRVGSGTGRPPSWYCNVASRRIAIVATTNNNRHRALSQQFGERRNPKSEGGNEGGK